MLFIAKSLTKVILPKSFSYFLEILLQNRSSYSNNVSSFHINGNDIK